MLNVLEILRLVEAACLVAESTDPWAVILALVVIAVFYGPRLRDPGQGEPPPAPRPARRSPRK